MYGLLSRGSYSLGIRLDFGIKFMNTKLLKKRYIFVEINTSTKMQSEGLGDTIDKITSATGIKKAVELTAKAVGIDDCGCAKRRELLNKKFPYKQKST